MPGDAEERLLLRMRAARARHAADHRDRSYIVPIGLVAVAVAASAEIYDLNPGLSDVIPISPLIAATAIARASAGVIAARVATILAVPIAAYLLWLTPSPEHTWLIAAYAITFAALCRGAALPPPWREPPRLLLGPDADAPKVGHTPPQ